MIKLSAAFRRALAENQRNYLVYADITLGDGAVLNLINGQIWASGMTIDNAVSEDNTFTALGSAIIGSATLVINNIDEEYSAYDFINAKVVLYVGMQLTEGSTTRLEKIKKGVYTVDDSEYNGGTITLTLLDNMCQFDRPYSLSSLAYPAKLINIINDACTKCGVALSASSASFPRKDTTVPTRPSDDATTFREVIGWAAAVAGCFCRCNRNGELELAWFDQTALETWDADIDGGSFDSSTPYATGAAVNGGTFSPWNVGDEAEGGDFDDGGLQQVSGLYSQNICVDDIVITGVSATVKDETDSATDATREVLSGSAGYVVNISDNPFVTPANAQSIVNALALQLVGLKFRKCNVTHVNDPGIEAGDVGILIDRKGNKYPILITRTTFTAGGRQTTVCGAETPNRNSATRISWQTKNYVEARRLLNAEKTARSQALDDLSDRLDAKAGLYSTVETTSSGTIYYLHDKPLKADSSVVWKMTAEAWGVSTDGGQTWNAGMTVDGTVIASILSTIGLDFDWGTGGTLTLGGNNNTNGLLRILNASGTEIVRGDNTGLTVTNGSISGTTIKIGGENNGYGSIEVYNNYGVQVGLLDNYSHLVLEYITAGEYSVMHNSNLNLNSTGLIFGGVGTMDSTHDETQWITHQLVPFYEQVLDPDDPWVATKDMGMIYFALRNIQGIRMANWMVATGGATTYSASTAATYYHYKNSSYPIYNGFNFYANVIGRNLYNRGTKSRIVDTEDYGTRALYCYETPSPMFGDLGSGMLDDTGECVIIFDDVFRETVVSDAEYHVFLQKCGEGDMWVAEKQADYFIVRGTPGLKFDWEVKLKQKDYTFNRLDDDFNQPMSPDDEDMENYTDVPEDIDYAAEGASYATITYNQAEKEAMLI